MKKKKVTAQEVAALAGVSQSTVSMVLNNRSDVSFSSATVQKVYEAAESLGYQLGRAPGLSTERKIIEIVTPNLYNPYYTCLAHAIENEAFDHGYVPLICSTCRDPMQEKAYLQLAGSSDVRGVLYVSMPLCLPEMRELSKRVPVVTITDKNELDDLDTIELDSAESGSIIAEHLLELGHRKIAFVTTPLTSENLPRLRRLEGVRRSLKDTDAELVVWEYKEERGIYRDVAHESRIGSAAAKELLSDKDITAFIGVNDMVAYGILDALAEAGCRVPEDYSVCGFDSLFVSHYRAISLTTIDHFLVEKGITAFEILNKHIAQGVNGGGTKGIYSIEYRPKLVKGHTTGPARRQPAR